MASRAIIPLAIRIPLAALACVLGMGLWAAGATAQEAAECPSDQDWAYCAGGTPKQCWGYSKPKSSAATRGGQRVEVRRGNIYLFVSYSGNEEGVVSFMSGYPLAEGRPVAIKIGDESFSLDLAADDSTREIAWARPADDARIIAAMKRGVDAVVTGVSSRGTTTVDTFSLLGFTATVTAAEAACKG